MYWVIFISHELFFFRKTDKINEPIIENEMAFAISVSHLFPTKYFLNQETANITKECLQLFLFELDGRKLLNSSRSKMEVCIGL